MLTCNPPLERRYVTFPEFATWGVCPASSAQAVWTGDVGGGCESDSENEYG